MEKHIVFASLNQSHDIAEFNTFADAASMAKEKLLEALEHNRELHNFIFNTSFDTTLSLSHTKYTDTESTRLAITIDYESNVIYVRYNDKDVYLHVGNHIVDTATDA